MAENTEITAEKPKIKLKEYDFELNDGETALVLAIQELTNQIIKLRLSNG